ncbi:sugar phosphate isomerase/epimerase [Brachybacterium sp. FME24]|uniref:sugar phosphate isomerase/epimerase family protein n=1 Tax=Brachybacterium sp. FME24 TaxID=2742605 RepID=UPI001867738D|nr:sugar phosphate isomerase/epimerase [Brachybacterium sp. FME24]
MQISVQLYSVREAFSADPDATLRRLSEIGFTTVEPFGLMENAETLRELLPRYGLAATSTHASLLTAEDPSRIFATAAGLGVRTVIDPHWDRAHWTREDDIKATAERLNALAPIATENGVRVGYHNHDFEARPLFEGRCGLEVLADHLDPRVVLELDTFWSAVGGTDPSALLGALGQRVQLAHLKDGPLQGDVKDQLPLGQGEMDVPAILAAAPWLETGVLEFDGYSGDIFEAVSRSLTQLNQYLQEDQA